MTQTNTLHTIGDAFYQAADTGRWLIKPDHPQEEAARRIVNAVGDQYGYDLGALDWAYKAAADILNAYTPEEIADPGNDLEIADALTSIYSNDLRRWYCEFPAVFEHHEQEAIDDGMLHDCRHVIETLQCVQCLAYEQAVRIVADELRAIEEEAEDAREYLACTDCGVEAGDAYISRTPFGDHANRCISCKNAYLDYVNKQGE